MKTRYKILLIAIPIALIASSAYINAFLNFMIDHNAFDDTPYDLEIMFDEEEYAVEYFVVNGNTDYVEIDIPIDMIDGVFMIHINGENVDDERVAIDGNKVIVNYGQNIETVKLFGVYEIGRLESGDWDALSSFNSGMSGTERLLTQKNIDYRQDRLVITGGPTFEGDPGCGAVVDVNDMTHWFEIDSISNPQTMTVLPENPHPCKVNTTSCFCNAQTELTFLTLNELSYFSPEEEKKYAAILLKYIQNNAGMKNIEPKFKIGKLNLNFTDPDAIGYCGERPGDNRNDFFSGAIVEGYVKDYGLDRELPLLCAIPDDAKWWENEG